MLANLLLLDEGGPSRLEEDVPFQKILPFVDMSRPTRLYSPSTDERRLRQ